MVRDVLKILSYNSITGRLSLNNSRAYLNFLFTLGCCHTLRLEICCPSLKPKLQQHGSVSLEIYGKLDCHFYVAWSSPMHLLFET